MGMVWILGLLGNLFLGNISIIIRILCHDVRHASLSYAIRFVGSQFMMLWREFLEFENLYLLCVNLSFLLNIVLLQSIRNDLCGEDAANIIFRVSMIFDNFSILGVFLLMAVKFWKIALRNVKYTHINGYGFLDGSFVDEIGYCGMDLGVCGRMSFNFLLVLGLCFWSTVFVLVGVLPNGYIVSMVWGFEVFNEKVVWYALCFWKECAGVDVVWIVGGIIHCSRMKIACPSTTRGWSSAAPDISFLPSSRVLLLCPSHKGLTSAKWPMSHDSYSEQICSCNAWFLPCFSTSWQIKFRLLTNLCKRTTHPRMCNLFSTGILPSSSSPLMSQL